MLPQLTGKQRDELASPEVEHGLPSRRPLCQLTAGPGCPGSNRRSLAIKAMEITDADRIRCLAARPADDTMTGCGSIYRFEAKA
jgi:hypothetical protein